MIYIELDNHKAREIHRHKDFEVIYVIFGHADIMVEGVPYRLKQSDFIVINMDQKHSYQVDFDSLIGHFHIPGTQMPIDEKNDTITFDLNSAMNPDHPGHEEIRKILKRIFNHGTEEKSKNSFHLQSEYYKFLDLLISNFSNTDWKQEHAVEAYDSDQRLQEISDYIYSNYNKNISLNDLAAKMYLSNAYLSKYIKRKLGLNFHELVDDARSNHAVTELMHTNHTIARIAMNNGFSNITAFNRSFHKKYGMTPTEYRNRFKKAWQEENNSGSQEPYSAIELHGDSGPAALTEFITQRIDISDQPKGELYKCWNRMINIGSAAELLNSDFQDHVVMLRDKLHFRYIRFWDIYSPVMYLHQHSAEKVYNFSRLDRVLDFLVNNHMTPHIEIANKPKVLDRKLNDRLIVPLDNLSLFKESAFINHFFTEFLIHLIDRYGAGELETWCFEYWMEENDNIFLNNEEDMDGIKQYISSFCSIAGVLRSLLPNIFLGGGGFSIRFGKEYLTQIISAMEKEEQQPNFLSFYVYPFSKQNNENVVRFRSMDENYLKSTLTYLNSLIQHSALKYKKLYVTEWNMTIYSRNIINDSCYKGAYIVKNIIDSIGLTDSLGYWTGSDLYGDFQDDSFFINGSCGLLTKDGIKKPAWYAFDFMNSLGHFLYNKGDNYIVTKDKYKSWQIVCHNFKGLNYDYYMRPEDEIQLSELDDMLINSKHLKLHFEIKAGEKEVYRVKIISLNRSSGSVQDEWLRMLLPKRLDQEDIEYLKSICIPRETIQNIPVNQGRLQIDTMLEPNEIQLILINYLKSCD